LSLIASEPGVGDCLIRRRVEWSMGCCCHNRGQQLVSTTNPRCSPLKWGLFTHTLFLARSTSN